MTDAAGFLAYLLLPLIGIAVWRLDGVRKLAFDGRLAIAGAAGALIVSVIMAVMPVVGLHWSRTRLVIVFVLIVTSSLWGRQRAEGRRQKGEAGGILISAFCLLPSALTFYGLLTARETCGDLLFFWGPKGVHFFRAGQIDLRYLFDPNNFYAHRDYPPLLPLLYAWSNTLSGQFSWWAAVLFTGLCLGGITAIVRAGTRSDAAALLTAATLACAFASAHIAGAADPLLLFFEAVAAGALLFIDEPRAQWIVAAIGVAGAVLTKVEGLSFAIAVVIVMLLRSRWLRVTVVLPAAVLLGAWLLVIGHYEMFDAYAGQGPIRLGYLSRVLLSTVRVAGYDAYWIPWIAPLIVIALGNFRRASVSLMLAALTLGATVFFYLHGPEDPLSFWVRSSAARVLLTPLLLLLMSAASAVRPSHDLAADDVSVHGGGNSGHRSDLVGALPADR
jgi:hypothetical protein